jgi:hypothetical protein
MNKITQIALIIPVHPRHYNILYNFIENIYNIIDIYCIFYDIGDYYMFKEKNKIKHIILPKNTTLQSIVTVKKFYGLKYLMYSSYDYFITLDAESLAISNNFTVSNMINKINSIYNNKIIYGNKTNDNFFINIMKTSSNVYNNTKQEILKKETDNFTIYTWWSDLPVYKKEYLNHFFNNINYNNIVTEHFDYIIYQYYLILYHNFKIVNTNTKLIVLYPPFTTTENEINQLNELKKLKFGFSFIPYPIYIRHSAYFNQQGTFLVINLDRT